MSSISDEKLLEYNRIGLIPGPNETLESFDHRVEYCLKLKENLSSDIRTLFDEEENSSPEIVVDPLEKLGVQYDIQPRWVPIFFSNYKLNFWQGGCAWIFQMQENSPTATLIQLRSSFRNKQKYLRIYDRDELLAHELSHVGRMMFEEPKYEEFFAYRTAPSCFRRWFGPIIQSSIESVIFVFILFFIVIFDFFLIALQRYDAYMISLWLKIIPLGFIFLGVMRLWQHHRILKKTLNSLAESVNNKDKAEAVAYRLRDKEIISFAKMTPTEIKEYANQQSERELRWRVINYAYFQNNH